MKKERYTNVWLLRISSITCLFNRINNVAFVFGFMTCLTKDPETNKIAEHRFHFKNQGLNSIMKFSSSHDIYSRITPMGISYQVRHY